MKKIAQTLSVAVAVVSVLFMALMVVVTTGGPNWRAISDDIEDYAFEAIAGERIRWSVTHRVTGTAVTTADTLPGAIVAALEDRGTRLSERLEEAEATLEDIRRRSDRVEQFRAVDEGGIERGFASLRSRIDEVVAETVRLTSDGGSAAETAAATRDVVEARRADAARIGTELGDVRTQIAAYETQNDRLRDRLTRIRGELGRAEARQEALRR